MEKITPLAILTAAIILIAGCANNPDKIKIPKDAAEMTVEFSWEGIAACTHDSPELRVSAVPDATTDLRVRLKDISLPEWNHGGGQVKHDGSGVIPAGALKLGYNGPCQPSGRHKYEFSVMAVNADGVIVGFGKARQSFPPK